MTCWLGSSPVGCIPIQITVSLWDMSGCLLVVVISYYVLMVDGWFRGLWLLLSWLCFINNVNFLVDACLMHVIVYRCTPNTWLN
jgi:hypothetical protein